MLRQEARATATTYRHTQTGWVTIGAVILGSLIALALVPLSGAPAPVAAALGAILVVGVLFATLTVEVDPREIRIRFTGGLVRRTIALSDVRSCQPVQNPWYYGWGIHRYPGGWIWNVSGMEAVELELADGRRTRIGTDEPRALARAIAAAAGPGVFDGPGADAPGRGARFGVGVAAAVLLGSTALVGLLVALFSVQMRDPQVTVSAERLAIDTLFYGDSYGRSDVASVALEPQLRPIRLKTNGFAARGILRGWFDVDGLGNGQVFVDACAPPFVLVRLRHGFVIVNFEDAARTRALHADLERLGYGSAR